MRSLKMGSMGISPSVMVPGQAAIVLATTAAPVWSFRIPKPGEVDPFFGGTRTFWLERVLRTKRNGFKPEIESIVVKKTGADRGMRFVVFESAVAYFQKLRADQQSGDQVSQ